MISSASIHAPLTDDALNSEIAHMGGEFASHRPHRWRSQSERVDSPREVFGPVRGKAQAEPLREGAASSI